MDKNAIKKFAVWARRELISRVSQKALQYGISEKSSANPKDEVVGGHILLAGEMKQRAALIDRIKEHGYRQVMDEAAYTWFNRFCALRFMEVNGYLPSRVRVFTDEQNHFKPQILEEAIHLDLDGLHMDKVFALKEANKTEELYKYLLITQCNALSGILPGMFQRIEDWTELLFPDNILREGSVIEQMISLIPEEDWTDQVQIIGWLYQYYNTEPKDKVFENLKKNIKISAENIPAATQLFTPDWIVHYMVENSLGRLWIEGHPNDAMKATWKYYLDEAVQEPEVEAKLVEIRKEYAAMKPEDIRVIDPCMGSGHILCVLFDILMQIYTDYGYQPREAVRSILEKNLYGLDIDDRAAQLAYFTVMMKARQYDQRFFKRTVIPHVAAVMQTASVDPAIFRWFGPEEETAKRIHAAFREGKLLGSLVEPGVTEEELDRLDARVTDMEEHSDLGSFGSQIAIEEALYTIYPVMEQARILTQKYDVVVTNPPYMGSNNMETRLSDHLKTAYPDSRSDLSTVFMEKTVQMCNKNGCMAMINIPVWMSKSSFEQLRLKLIENHTFINMIHNGRGIFGSDFGTTAFVIKSEYIDNYSATFHQLFDEMGAVDSVEQKEKWFLEGKGKHIIKQIRFRMISSYPIAYSTSSKLLEILDAEKPLNNYAFPRKGLTTGDNDIFVRLWHEVSLCKFIVYNQNGKWFPMTKGGDFRRWYGNNDYIINWENNGYDLKHFFDENGKLRSVIRNEQYYLRESISWNDTTATGKIAFRYQPKGYISNASGPCVFADNNLKYLFGMLNSVVSQKLLEILAPNMKFEVGQMALVPIIMKPSQEIDNIVNSSIQIAKCDWDSFETSWDFKCHPLYQEYLDNLPLNQDSKERYTNPHLLSNCYTWWATHASLRFDALKRNEEELNRIFIDIYGLQDELTPEVEDKDVTVRLADRERDIKSLISYAVGCMFGRYSLDTEGLAWAGGEWDHSKYRTWIPDADNILPICDEEYFDDDLAGLFVKWVETVYGHDTLEENLAFIADSLGGKGTPRDVIRGYFLNDFYADHLKVYQKRPIYWLFDSGKKNGFKCLIYMHRYQPDTIARIRTDYVHAQQARFRNAIEDVEKRQNAASGTERVRLTKQLEKLTAQAEEIRVFEEKIHHLADQMIKIDLDDGVKDNYAKFGDVLAKIK